MVFLPALHVKAALVGHQDFFLLFLDASFQGRVIAGVGRVADDCCVPEKEDSSDDDDKAAKSMNPINSISSQRYCRKAVSYSQTH